MNTTTIVIVNLVLSLLAVLGVAGLTLLAHRLPSGEQPVLREDELARAA